MIEEQERAGLERLRRVVAAESRDGNRLASDIGDNPVCSLSIDRDLRCVILVWRTYATGAQLRFIHESMLDLLRRHRLRKILRDDTDLPTLHDDDQQWIAGSWMPRALAAGLRFSAYKTARAYSGKVAMDRIMALAPSGLTIRSFGDLEEARLWLRSV